jgi:hypothetical protein
VERSSAKGFLRAEVELVHDDQADRIRFAHWEVALPPGFLKDHVDLRDVLCRIAPASSVEQSSESAGVIALLDAQGCFASEGALEQCTLQQLRRIFDRLKSAWYAEYYSHPLWDRLRSGRATRNELLAWVVHNYHVSRIAGGAAARCASRPYARRLRDRFLQDTFEEYWHSDAYYFVKHPSLNIRDEDIKRYVPLAGSRAFELHTLQVADRDDLAHLLIAYFQESSVAFYDDCVDFYDAVERAYDLPGFFEPWKAHMRLDLSEGHAQGLATLFDCEEVITPDRQISALRGAWIAFRFLYHSLDHVQEQARINGTLDLRSPRSIDVRSAPASERTGADGLSSEKIRGDLARCAFAGSLACLGRAADHDVLMMLGRLCRDLERGQESNWLESTRSIWVEAIGHQIAECSSEPARVANILMALNARCGEYGVRLFDTGTMSCIDRLRHLGTIHPGDGSTFAVDAHHARSFLDCAFTGDAIDNRAYQP